MNHGEHTKSTFKSEGGMARIAAAFGYSLKGLRSAWRHEHAFRQELLVALPAALLALLLPVPVLHQAALIAVLLLVLMVELLNSAIEAVVDRISLKAHPLSGRAKDLGSAAVLLACLIAAVTWGALLAPLWPA